MSRLRNPIIWSVLYVFVVSLALYLNHDALLKLKTLEVLPIIIIVFGQIALLLGSVYFNFILYRICKIKILFLDFFAVIVQAMMLDQVVPKGGLALKLAVFKKKYQVPISMHMAVLTIAAIIILLGMSSLVGSSFFFSSIISLQDSFKSFSYLVFTMILFFFISLLLWPKILKLITQKLSIAKELSGVLDISFFALVPTFIICLANQLVYALLFQFLFKQIGFSLSYVDSVFFSTASSLTAIFAITPNGVGVLELALFALGKIYGLNLADVLFASVVIRASSLFPLIILLPVLNFASQKKLKGEY